MSIFFVIVFGALGGTLVLRAGQAQWGHDLTASVLIAVIGLFFLLGIVELGWRSLRASRLLRSLTDLPRSFADLPAAQAVIGAQDQPLASLLSIALSGARPTLVNPGFTPYLVSLLIMVGLLGTFLGFVDTLAGARAVLGKTADLEGLRAGLATPLLGLSRSFSASLAGVSASAALGAAAAFVRRGEGRTASAFERYVRTSFSSFTPAGRQLSALSAMAEQGAQLPIVAETLVRLTEQLPGTQREAAAATAAVMSQATARLELEVSKGFSSARDEVRAAVAEVARLAAERMFEAMELAVRSQREQAQAADAAWRLEVRAAEQARTTEVQRGLHALEALQTQASRSLSTLVEAQVSALSSATDGLSARLDRLGQSMVKSLDEVRVRELSRVEQVEEGLVSAKAASVESGRQTDALLAQTQATLAALEVRLSALTASFERGLSEVGHQVTSSLERQTERHLLIQNERVLETASVLSRIDEELGRHLTTMGRGLAEPLAAVAESAREAPALAAALLSKAAARWDGLDARDVAREARLDTLLVNLEGVSAAWQQAGLRQAGAFQAALDAGGERSEAAEFAAAARFESLSLKVEAAVLLQADRLTGFEERLATTRDQNAESLASQLAAHAQKLGEGLDATGALVREAASLVHTGGAELSAVAEMFTAAVDRYRESSEEWRRVLASLEEVVSRSQGQGESGAMMGTYLDQTREVFGDAMRFQRELFTELRELRALRGPSGT